MDSGMTAAYLKKHDIEAPGLVDREGTVGKMYDARTTPHMYIIDKEGVLRYSGAIDDDQSGRSDSPTNFVVQAMRQIAAGETVAPDSTRPYGCSVKYASK